MGPLNLGVERYWGVSVDVTAPFMSQEAWSIAYRATTSGAGALWVALRWFIEDATR
jgi:hypothetical protein